MKKYINFVFLMVFIIFVLQSCVSKSTVQKNENIDANTSYEISLLNDKLIKSIITLDTISIKSLLSEGFLKKSGNNLEKIFKDIHPILKKVRVKNLTSMLFIITLLKLVI